MFDQELAARRGYMVTEYVRDYVRDVYSFLTMFVMMYFVGAFLPSQLTGLYSVSVHYYIIASLLTTILTLGMPTKNFFFGSLSAMFMGITSSAYFSFLAQNYPETILMAGLGTFLIFATATLCATMFPTRELTCVAGLLLTGLELFLVFYIMEVFAGITFMGRNHVYISLGIMTMYVYYDTLRMYERAKMRMDVPTSMSRQTAVVYDAYALFLDVINIFTDLLRILARDQKRRKED